MTSRSLRFPFVIALAAIGLTSWTAAIAQTVPLAGGTAPIQTFDSLAATGTASTVPEGWSFVESGTNANSTYLADNGAANSGNTFSFGAIGSGERAFGMLRSGSLVPIVGAHLRNESGNSLAEIAVAYTGEQWRLGTLGRSDRLDFQYSVNATALNDAAATWVDVNTLDFTAPVAAGAVGALDGNAAANRTAISATITGLSLPDDATMWVRWIDVDASGADDGLAIDDASFTVSGDPPVDVPPTVVSTSPVNNAGNVALAATLSVSFSEPVTLGASWFTLSCNLSGTHTAVVGGGPSTYSLTPSPAFAADETCTWTILASGVTDIDGTPNPLANDVVVTFTTLDPGSIPAPGVIYSLPAQGATRVPFASDIRLSFSEIVTTTAGAFALTCNGAPIALGEVGTGVVRTLIPVSVMPTGANCVFAIDADKVRNAANVPMDESLAIGFSVIAPYDASYYSGVNTSDPGQLRCSLHATIRGHTMYPYSGAATSTWTVLEIAQAKPGDPTRIIDVYRNRAYLAGLERAGTGSGITYNREHSWPNSLGFPSMTGDLGLPNAPYTDTHMLYLSDTQWNSDRGNKPYAYCPVAASCGERITEVNGGVGGGSGVYPGNSNWVNGDSFETWNHRKGETARTALYMAIRYEGGVDPLSGQLEPNLELTDNRGLIATNSNYNTTAYMGLLTDLLAWHAADPPDAEEIARNGVIYGFQGNRNPFIDNPQWATRELFESVSPVTCELGDSIFVDGFELMVP